MKTQKHVAVMIFSLFSTNFQFLEVLVDIKVMHSAHLKRRERQERKEEKKRKPESPGLFLAHVFILFLGFAIPVLE